MPRTWREFVTFQQPANSRLQRVAFARSLIGALDVSRVNLAEGSMRVLGAAPAADHLALVVLEVNDGAWSLVETSATRKVPLGDHEDSHSLRAFVGAVEAFINSHKVEKVVIRRCTYKGQKRSGAPSIKMEALLQLLSGDVQLLPAQTIRKRFKEHGAARPAGLAGYQDDAFATALSAATPSSK